jgi:hypothetical protein
VPQPNKRTPFTNTYPRLPSPIRAVCVLIPRLVLSGKGKSIPERRNPAIMRRFHNTKAVAPTAIFKQKLHLRDLFY